MFRSESNGDETGNNKIYNILLYSEPDSCCSSPAENHFRKQERKERISNAILSDLAGIKLGSLGENSD